MMKKGLVCGILILLIGMNIVSSVGSLTLEKHALIDNMTTQIAIKNNGETLYVGGDGPDNYSKIQYAIDNASDGDTIFVYTGYYDECVKINKSIELFGEDKNNTIISSDGKKFLVDVNDADNFKIHGFKIMNAGILIFMGNNAHIYNNIVLIENQNRNGVDISAHSCLIEVNEIIGGMAHGVRLNGNYNVVKNNIISGVKSIGILVEFGSNIEIRNNIISGNNKGLMLTGSTTEDSIIVNNEISYNNLGVESYWPKSNIVKKNNFIGNQNSAIFYIWIELFLPPFSINSWSENYWDDWLGIGPYKIKGTLSFFSYYLDRVIVIKMRKYDWNPAKEPYDIPCSETINILYEYSDKESGSQLIHQQTSSQ